MSDTVYSLDGHQVLPSLLSPISVTGGAGTYTYGAWSQFSASIASNVYITGVVFYPSTIHSFYQLAIGIGGAGSEVIKAETPLNVPNAADVNSYIIPIRPYLRIPAGSRIACCAATNGTGATIPISLMYISVSSVVLGFPTGAVATDGSNSATSFKTNRTESTTDFWKDSFLRITSGALIDQVKKVTAYNGSTKFVTCDAFTGIPADGVTFDLINR